MKKKLLRNRVLLTSSMAALATLAALFGWALSPIYDVELLPDEVLGRNDEYGTSVAIGWNVALVGVPLDDDKGEDAGAVYVFVRHSITGAWSQEDKLYASDTSLARSKFGRAVAISRNGNRAVIGAPSADHLHGRAYVFERDFDFFTKQYFWQQTDKLSASDQQLLDTEKFGNSVAIDLNGDTILVGAPGDLVGLREAAGSAYFFAVSQLRRDNTVQTEQAKLLPSYRASGASFGYSVAADGDVILIGAPHEDNTSSGAGAVYRYSRSSLATSQTEAEIISNPEPSGYEWFGVAIALGNGIAIISAPGQDGPQQGTVNAGAIYVYSPGAGGSWSDEAEIHNPDRDPTGNFFGSAIALDGNSAIVGAPGYASGQGAAHLYEWDAASSTLRHSDRMLNPGSGDNDDDEFGHTVAADRNVVLVGAPFDDVPEPDAGAAYAFTLVIVDDDEDGIEDKLDNCPDAANGSLLGTCLTAPGSRGWAPSGRTCTDANDCLSGELCSLSQADLDEDGLGDACDDNVDDDDEPNAGDYCPWLHTFQNVDSDGDRVGDECDSCYDSPFVDEVIEQNNWTNQGCVGCGDRDPDPDSGDPVGDGYYAGCDAYETIPGPDCNDGDILAYPGAPERCNGNDDDCDGLVDEDAGTVYYRDADDDDYSDGATQQSCTRPPAGYKAEADLIATSGDCRDGDPDIHPGAEEVCNHVDDDCDGEYDEGVSILYYRDRDRDGYSDGDFEVLCPGEQPHSDYRLPAELIALEGDCDDSRDWIYPGAPELCNYYDDDCDEEVDEGLDRLYYNDLDDDGHGGSDYTMETCEAVDPEWKLESELISIAGDCNHDDTNNWVSCVSCRDGDEDTWYVGCDRYTTILGPDCDDAQGQVNPGATEVCNGRDDDCDGLVDEDLLWWADWDRDGYGDPDAPTCNPQPEEHVQNSLDCNDQDNFIYPGAEEVCNRTDDDCDGEVDEGLAWYHDGDLDGYGDPNNPTCYPDEDDVENDLDCDDGDPDVNPGAEELCNGIDDDCDGDVDEVCNEPPVASCQDVEVSVDSAQNDCVAGVSIDDGSYDPDQDPLTFVADPAAPYAVGEHLVTLTVSDGEESDDCTGTVTVTSEDPICIPEPGVALLGAAALGSLAWLRRRRRIQLGA